MKNYAIFAHSLKSDAKYFGFTKLAELAYNHEMASKQENIDFVIVNAENSAGGMGITTKIFNDLIELKIDTITMGNHTWGKKDIFSFIDNPKLIRPANYSKGVVGKGFGIYECKGKKIGVINLIGRINTGGSFDSPFTVADKEIEKLKRDAALEQKEEAGVLYFYIQKA